MGVGYVTGTGPVCECHDGGGTDKGWGGSGKGNKKDMIVVVRKLEGGVESCLDCLHVRKRCRGMSMGVLTAVVYNTV